MRLPLSAPTLFGRYFRIFRRHAGRRLLWLVVIYALMSWFAGASYSPVGLVLGRICEPLLAPFRRLIPPLGGLDLSALFLIIALQAVIILLR